MYATPGSIDEQLLIFKQGKAHDVTEFFPGTKPPMFAQRAAGLTLL
jgi:hypothetical protein